MDIKKVPVTRSIDNVGRIVIPKKTREKFKMEIGDDVEFYETDKGLLIVKVPKKEGV